VYKAIGNKSEYRHRSEDNIKWNTEWESKKLKVLLINPLNTENVDLFQ